MIIIKHSNEKFQSQLLVGCVVIVSSSIKHEWSNASLHNYFVLM